MTYSQLETMSRMDKLQLHWSSTRTGILCWQIVVHIRQINDFPTLHCVSYSKGKCMKSESKETGILRYYIILLVFTILSPSIYSHLKQCIGSEAFYTFGSSSTTLSGLLTPPSFFSTPLSHLQIPQRHLSSQARRSKKRHRSTFSLSFSS